MNYDRLILTTGSVPFVPPIEGVNLPGVFLYRTLEDIDSIKKEAEKRNSAVILGGGLLGLEAAKALYDYGLQITIVEKAPTLMPRQVDDEGARLLEQKIRDLGVDIKLIHSTEKITKTENGLRVHFKDRGEFETGMLVISTGIRPRDELARECGLEIGNRGGIVVDEFLQTSDPNIYAAGECACHRGIVYGLAMPGYMMAEVIAENISYIQRAFLGSDFSAQLKLMGVEVSSIGQFLESGEYIEYSSYRNENSYTKLILRRNRLIGFKLIGVISIGPNSELPRLEEAIREGRWIFEWHRLNFEKTGFLWNKEWSENIEFWPANSIVCSCMKVTRGEITKECEQGCQSIEQLSDATKACTVCGTCKPLLEQLLGKTSQREVIPGTKSLLAFAILAFFTVMLILFSNPPEAVQTVMEKESFLVQITKDNFWKQFTGYSILSATALTLILSVRKRVPRISFGNFNWWRVIHSALGTFTVLGLIFHTNWRLGSNFNAVLMICFLIMNLAGALTASLASAESNAKGPFAIWLRRWRPRLLQLHIWMFWPFPVLVAFHILAVYYYG